MSNAKHFVIENNAGKPIDLYIEPEGALFGLKRGEKVTVREQFTKSPVSVIVSTSESGATEVTTWPGDGEVRVEKDGVDVLDLIQEKGVGECPGSALATLHVPFSHLVTVSDSQWRPSQNDSVGRLV
jgi:hypothetical protein